jgi:cobalt-zinc-cadmium efflux system protein
VMVEQSGPEFLGNAAAMLQERFGIAHTTIQIERGADCATDC